jgi:hypothetical protein
MMNRKFYCLIGVSLLLLVGCDHGLQVPPSDVATARVLLDQSLRSWSEGKTVEDLRNQTPPVFVAEDNWLRGSALSKYSIDDAGELYGSNARFNVTLQMETEGSKTVRYLVTTVPALTIAKEDQ